MPSISNKIIAWGLAYFFCVYLPQSVVRPAWPWIVSSFGPTWWELLYRGNILINIASILILNICLFPMYRYHVFDGLRCDSSKPWPWRSDDKDVRDTFWKSFRGSLFLVPFNAFVVAYAALYLTSPLALYIGAFSIESSGFPSTKEFFCHLAVALVVEDTMFYFTHRGLHEYLYKSIHSWHHEYTSVIALSSEHAHPVEFALGNLLPVITGPLLMRSHMFTLWAFVFLRVVVSHDEHCGFNLPWSPVRILPFGSSANAHAWHHRYFDGMYASQFSFWDSIFATDKGFKVWESKQRAQKVGLGKRK